MKKHGPVQATMNVVFARPLQLDRCAIGAERLGDRYRFDDVVRAGVGAPPEAAAGEERVDTDLLGFKPGSVCGIGLIDRLELIAGPDLATAGCEFDDRI